MLFLLDSADVAAVARAAALHPLAGLTTNPTLLARARRPLAPLLADLRTAVGPDLPIHAQVVGADVATMCVEAERLRDRLGAAFHPKVPVTPQGLAAIRALAARGFAPTATAVFTPLQALLAARAGAAFVAPYVARIDASGGDGPATVGEIARLFAIHAIETRILAASFKSVRQILAVALAGAHSATLPPDLLDAALAHPSTDTGVAGFLADWADAYGRDTTVADLLPDDRRLDPR
jgi:fructose-6-phosphate aldolase 2